MNLTLPGALRDIILFSLLVSAATTAVWALLAYLVLKAAIKNAIRESGLVDALRRSRAVEAPTKSGLPKMTID